MNDKFIRLSKELENYKLKVLGFFIQVTQLSLDLHRLEHQMKDKRTKSSKEAIYESDTPRREPDSCISKLATTSHN